MQQGTRTMIKQQLRRSGNSYVITIPKQEVERNGWQVGQRFVVQLTLLQEQPVLRPELQKKLDESWSRHEAAYRYLADK
jgi:antitoxin component of MazEF toxin-antitoxin module